MLLAKLVIKAAPSALDPRALNLPKDHGGALPEAARLQNVTLALHAAASIGAVVAGLTPRQLRLASAHRGAALELLWQLTRAKFRARLAPVLRRMGEAGGGGGGGGGNAAARTAVAVTGTVAATTTAGLLLTVGSEDPSSVQQQPARAVVLDERTRQQRMGKQSSFERMRRMGKQSSFERLRRRQQRLPDSPVQTGTRDSGGVSQADTPPPFAAPTPTPPVSSPMLPRGTGVRRPRKVSREGRGFVKTGVVTNDESRMLRWINLHLEAHAATLAQPEAAAMARGFPGAVTDLGASLADGRALAVVLHRIAPAGSCDLRWLSPLLELTDAEGGTEARAAALLEVAGRLNVTFELAPADVVAGRWRLMYCFVASLMTCFWAARGGGGAADEAAADDAEEREELALRSWMASLGLGRQLGSVAEDCRDGVLLLKLCERLRPGCVQWNKVRTRHPSVYARAESCNYALEVVRSLGMTAVGISGQDIAVASAKLTMGVVWQLMRADVLRFLSTVQVDASHVHVFFLLEAYRLTYYSYAVHM